MVAIKLTSCTTILLVALLVVVTTKLPLKMLKNDVPTQTKRMNTSIDVIVTLFDCCFERVPSLWQHKRPLKICHCCTAVVAKNRGLEERKTVKRWFRRMVLRIRTKSTAKFFNSRVHPTSRLHSYL